MTTCYSNHAYKALATECSVVDVCRGPVSRKHPSAGRGYDDLTGTRDVITLWNAAGTFMHTRTY